LTVFAVLAASPAFVSAGPEPIIPEASSFPRRDPVLKLQDVGDSPALPQPPASSTRYLEEWLGRVVVVQVVNMPTEYSHPAYVGTLKGVDRDANGSIQSILLAECTAGTTQRTFQADNVIVWSSVMRISLPGLGLQEAHESLIAKVHSGDYLYR
jgi:hypothetical protein